MNLKTDCANFQVKMSGVYKFREQEKPYFITMTIVDWVDLFTRKEYCNIVLECLNYCQDNKGLIVYAWVIMPSHIHMVIGTNQDPMQNILRDFKRQTSKRIRHEVINHPGESRREWLLQIFRKAGIKNSNNINWQLWQQNNQPIELWDNYMIDQKIDYLHNNPVVAGYVSDAENWFFSSAVDFTGQKGILTISEMG